MKHILVVNPAAGHTNALPRIREEAEKLKGSYDVEIYETKGKGDATAFVKETIAAHPDAPIRFYSCGGDGTLKEVANGAVGAKNASVSCYPCGSGNDFVKYYGGAENFLSLAALFEGEEREIDLITDGTEYSINIANFGFDYAVCETMEKVRRFPLLGGKRAYYAGIVTALFTAMKKRVKVYADGELLTEDDRFLLCTLANGTYIGGSYMCAPRSDNEDGLLELCYVKSISVPRFLKLMGYYKRGEHLDMAALAPYIIYKRVSSIEVSSTDKDFGYTLDGELHPCARFTLTIVPKALRFAIPKTAAAFCAEREKKRHEAFACK
ncbi:MAG: diacylglycerol kinase family lipid kinase [Ruminococcaceae bacterium]|nr:diacylglycerol kinase family lipid kinase [Oscillospiraceae bacterium]